MKLTPLKTELSAEALSGKTVLFKYTDEDMSIPLHGDLSTFGVAGGFMLQLSYFTKIPERAVRWVGDDEAAKIRRNETGETDFIML